MKNLIGGKKIDASRGGIVEVLNPATGEIIDTVPNSTIEDISLAVTTAKRAQKKWKKVPLYERGEILYKFVLIILCMVNNIWLHKKSIICNGTGKHCHMKR